MSSDATKAQIPWILGLQADVFTANNLEYSIQVCYIDLYAIL